MKKIKFTNLILVNEEVKMRWGGGGTRPDPDLVGGGGGRVFGESGWHMWGGGKAGNVVPG